MTNVQPIAKTFIRVNSDLELRRSPVDGMWRAWGLIADPCQEKDDADTHGVGRRWVTLAVNQKARAAIDIAQDWLGGRPAATTAIAA